MGATVWAFTDGGKPATRRPSPEQPENQSRLEDENADQRRPCQRFPKAERLLRTARQPESQAHGSHVDHVTIPQLAALLRFSIDGRQGVGLGRQQKTLFALEIDLNVSFPNTGVIKTQPRLGGATHQKRKLADRNIAARQFSRKNLELNHKTVRGIWM